VDQGLIDDTYVTAKGYFNQPREKKMEPWIYKKSGIEGM
jgi:hypothetical protein